MKIYGVIRYLPLLALAIGCTRLLPQDDPSFFSGRLASNGNPATTILQGVAHGSGNGEGYNGKTSLYAVNPGHPCTNGVSMSAARSILTRDSTGTYITRTDCVDHAPQAVPSSVLSVSPYDPNIVSVNGVIFEQAPDPATLSQSYVQVICRGQDPVIFNSAQSTYVDIVIRNTPGAPKTGPSLVPFSTLQQELVIGTLDLGTGNYVINQQVTSDVQQMPQGNQVAYMAVQNGAGNGSVMSQLLVNTNQAITDPPVFPAPVPVPASLPSGQTFSGTFSGLVQDQMVQPTPVTCNTL